MSGWPAWLDEIESRLSDSDRTCPDCYVVIDDVTVFKKFRGDGCDHGLQKQPPQGYRNR